MSSAFSVNDFIRKWMSVELKERSAAQEHFLDLCRLLGEPSPAEVDPVGDFYCFERGATKTSGGDGWADVWKRGFYGWEYKGKRKNLDAAFGQLQQYVLALENPPLLVVCDLNRFVIRTNWTNTVSEKHDFALEELREPRTLQKLKWVMSDPEKLRPGKTRQDLTEEAAAEFAALAQGLRDRKHDAAEVAHFVNRLVFCMFAEDVDLLPGKMFLRMLEAAEQSPCDFQKLASSLFAAMKSGGLIGFERIEWFNGGLFDDDKALALVDAEIKLCIRAAKLDWSEIDPSIFGTLFVRGLDPSKRSETGAEYTDREKIMMIVEPVVSAPLLKEWVATRDRIKDIIDPATVAAEKAIVSASGHPELAQEVQAVESRLVSRPQLELFDGLERQRRVRKVDAVRTALRAADRALTAARDKGKEMFLEFMARLQAFRVLDPACGSGNFLYLALIEIKNVERRVAIDGEILGFPPRFPEVGPQALLGIEINPYAAELTRVSVWIGEIQWMRRHGFDIGRRPVLKPLMTIECRNALLNEDGTEANWPDANVIIGNPPFLGAKLMYRRLGRPETERIRQAFLGRLSGFTDLVCYWFEKSRAHVCAGRSQYVGLVSTKSISKNTNLPVLIKIRNDCDIFSAWSNEPWVVDGAAVRVSIICFRTQTGDVSDILLDGNPVPAINPDLTCGVDVTKAKELQTNLGYCFVGIQKSGPLDVPGELARKWIELPVNPNMRPNSDILRPYWNGDDIVGRPRDVWLVDYPPGLSEDEASLFEAPFKHISTTECDPPKDNRLLKESRENARDEHATTYWWMPYWNRPELRRKLSMLLRYLVTPMTAEHRIFYWLPRSILPDNNLVVIAKCEDLYFGILSSRFHEIWSTARGNRMGKGNQRRYNGTSIFETFPFPVGLSPDASGDSYAGNRHALAISLTAEDRAPRRGVATALLSRVGCSIRLPGAAG